MKKVDYLENLNDYLYSNLDPNEVPEYAFTAFEYFRAREQAQPITDYIQSQGEINEKMRQVLVDWLVEVNAREIIFIVIHY